MTGDSGNSNKNTTNVVLISQESINKWLAPYGASLTIPQIEQVQKYISLLVLWNQKISLTSIEDPQEIVCRHFGESFFASKFIENPACRLADVGSGAGFPGLALKIVLPNLQVSLIEQDTRKATFLNEVIRLLDLAGVRVHRSPYESLPPEFGNLDFITARAVGNHKELLKWAAARLGPDGQIMLWLGADDAIRVSQLPGWQWHLPHALPNSRNRILLLGVAAK
jgi:16S rRNA (guanine527-N7)-methyltransferase